MISVICVEFWSNMSVHQTISMNLFLYILCDFMGIYKILLNQVLIPKDFRPGLLPVDRARSRSTDVHKTCMAIWLVDRSIRRSTVQRAALSGSGPGRPGGRPIGQSPGSVDRVVDRQAAMVKNLTVGRSIGRSTDSRVFCWLWPQRLYFLGLFWAILHKILSEFSS